MTNQLLWWNLAVLTVPKRPQEEKGAPRHLVMVMIPSLTNGSHHQLHVMDDGSKSVDQDWLLSSELQEERLVSKKVKHITGASWCSSPSLWPHAQYLHEVELYALPYAIPF
ncbi:hypothetical protein SESBI_39811 [Sesbania bispinosa]|nr:hypothetical protein SESBI_39811 [Sesbania bispinosa]